MSSTVLCTKTKFKTILQIICLKSLVLYNMNKKVRSYFAGQMSYALH